MGTAFSILNLKCRLSFSSRSYCDIKILKGDKVMGLNDSIDSIVHWDGPSIQGDETLERAICRMADIKVGGLLVKQDGNVLGVITDWDIMHSIDNGYDPTETKVSKFMTSCEVMLGKEIKSPCVQLDASIRIKDALRVMAMENVHHLMITGSNDEVGLVSSLDLLKGACS
jgi:predicted transcriptional regulator